MIFLITIGSLGNGHNTVWLPIRMCATLFDSGDGTGAGRMEIRNGSYYNLGVYHINNVVSSLNMDAGCVLFSYVATDFQNGVTQTFKGYAQSSNLYIASDLVNGLNDEMSSLECFCNLISIDGESFICYCKLWQMKQL